ncbi:hypothetical protein VTI74DRAFT_1371 [Chaetomium olivicolor]
MSDRRGRRHSRSEDRYDDRYYYDDYGYEHRPRHRSLGRQALDKLGDAMESLGLESRKSHHHESRRHRSHSRSHDYDRDLDRYYYPTSHHGGSSTRRYHSTSPGPSRHSRRSRRESTTGARSSRRVPSRSRSRIERGVEAAVEAAAAEAFRLRHEPGPWKGPKGQRVATAAISAGVLGAATEKRKQTSSAGGKLGTMGSALGGLVVNRLVNGPRKEVRR